MSSNNNITSASAYAIDNNNTEEGAHHVSTINNTASTITTPINTTPKTPHDETQAQNINNTAPIYPAVNNNTSVTIARYDSSFNDDNDDDDSESNESSSVENNDMLYTTPKSEEQHSRVDREDKEEAVTSGSSKDGMISEHTIKLTREIEELGSLGKKKEHCTSSSSLDVKPALLKTEETDKSPNIAKKQDKATSSTIKKSATITHYPFKKSTKHQPSTQLSTKGQNKSIPLHTLPTDALHTTSSYCTPSDWANLCSTNSIWKNIGKDIFGKVWRHAGLCMLEIGYAWARGEHADARELASLYISKGVPIYPTPHGHSYHTIVWRMGIELENNNNSNNEGDEETAANRMEGNANNNNAQQQQRDNNNNGNDINVIIDEALGNNNGNIAPNNNDLENRISRRETGGGDNNISRGETDAFYTDRYIEENGNNDRVSLLFRNHSTYVEEKAIFWKQQKGIEVDTSSRGPGLFPRRRFSFTAGGGDDGGPLRPMRHAAAPQAAPPQDAPQAADEDEMEVVEEGIGRPPPGMAAGARPQSAASGQRLQQEAADGVHDRYARRSSFSGSSSTTANTSSPTTTTLKNPPTLTSPSNYTSPVSPKLSLHIHRHLADQHFFGSASVNDESGTMSAGSISMHADFFHPTWEGRHGVTTKSSISGEGGHSYDNWGDVDRSIDDAIFNRAAAAIEDNDDIGETVDDRIRAGLGLQPVDNREARHNPRMVDSNYRAAVRAFVSWTMANADRQRRNSMPNSAGGTLSMAAVPSLWNSGISSSSPSPATDVHLDVYSSSSANLKSDNETETSTSDTAVTKMHARCLRYQQLMNTLLKSNSWCQSQFQEVLLDFWDELFPSTAGIHFYNQQSPVPRMSKLHTFLTTPCPKAIGTIQCEIERVTVRNRKGGKGVKGRFFPSYEYRLFIRDTKNDNPFQSSRHPPRQDSVLLVAKSKSSNKNRNVNSNGGGGLGSSRRGSGVGGLDFATPSALASPANSPGGNSNKRGITNFYMSLPQQKDVDSHYMSANRNNTNLSKNESSGLGVSPLTAQSKDAIEVGRLQSNFIGTEFQIFSPTKTSSSPPPPPAPLEPEQEPDVSLAEGDSRVHPVDTPPPVTNTTARRRSRRGSGLVRLAQRASMTMSRRGSARNSTPTPSEPTEESAKSTRRGSKKLIRRLSWGSSTNATKRMSLGSSNDPTATDQSNADTLGEVESGAITYTANLLGNRPRIMDVCIPKLTEDGKVCDQWSGDREENIISSDGYGAAATSTMLDRFKTIQQDMDNVEDAAAAPNNNAAEATAAAAAEHGLMMLQNRPPWWNLELGAFVLNFGGRVKVASVKNFQLCERDDQEHVMQFGRIEGRHAFTLDYAHPLTPVQAFAIAISSLQSKISFGN